MKKFIVFDLDGTLVDTLIGLTEASNVFLERFEYPYRYSYDEVKEFIGNGSRKLFLCITHRTNFDELLEKQYIEFLKIYEENQYISKPYEGVEELLQYCNENDIKLIVYSNKPDHILKKLVNHLFKNIKFEAIQGSLDKYKVKPDVTLLNEILDKLSLSSYEGLYVGDSYTDYLTAINAHMDMLFLTYGYCHEDEKDKINCLKIDKFTEIYQYLK